MDLAIVNGAVWRPGNPQPATAVAIFGEHIAAIGTDDEILALTSTATRVIDAEHGTIMPAFNDAHVHFLMGSRALGELDLHGAETLDEVERRITAYAKARREGWVVGRGWFYSAFPGAMPTVALLDRLIPDRPAFIESYDAHTGWANSKALALAGTSTIDVLREEAMGTVTRHIPARTRSEELDALRAGMRLAAAHGIASVQEAGHGLDQLPLWDALHAAGDLTLRVRVAFDVVPGMGLTEWKHRLDEYEEVTRARAPNGWVTTGILKAFADGVIESRTAWVLDPYEGEVDGMGAPNFPGSSLAEDVRAASGRGWQVQVHAIGAAAIRQALDAFAGTAPERRHRIEHIEAPSPLDINRFDEVGVIASMQPQHAEPNRNLFDAWAKNLGPTRAAGGWPWASLLRSSARLAFGSDWPVVPIDPFFSLHVAVNRQTRDHTPPGGWIPAERLSLEQAVEPWTSGSAYAEHAEHTKGEIRAGLLADLAVLDRNLGAIREDEIKGTKVTATVVGGRIVYEG